MQNRNATLRLIELAESLSPTGVIGDGMVAEFHDAARRARAEQAPRSVEVNPRGDAISPRTFRTTQIYEGRE